MTEVLSLMGVGLSTFGIRVHAVAPDQWDAPTPNEQWTVADLVGHLAEEHSWVAPLLDGHELAAAGRIAAAALHVQHGDPTAQWDAAALESGRAFGEPGALDRTVDLSSGPTPARAYADEMIMDLAVHAWDLGRAIGYSEPLPEDLVQAALRQAHSYDGDLTGSMFAAPHSVSDDASDEDRLIALTGRDPGWAPPGRG